MQVNSQSFFFFFFLLPSPNSMSFVYPYHRAFFPVVLVVPPYSYKVIQNISFILEVTAVNTALEVHWCTPLELVD